MAKLPKWGDDAALTAWVSQLMPERHFDVLFPELITVQSGVPWQSWDAKAMEREAFEAARQGDFRMLGWMLDKHMPLTRESMDLIAARLMGKLKAGPGAAKQAIARRRAANPVHNASVLPTAKFDAQMWANGSAGSKNDGSTPTASVTSAARANACAKSCANFSVAKI
jgi:hypothetical protein